MPYICPANRPCLASGRRLPSTPGELNFVISRLVRDYCLRQGKSYQTINDIVGVLECAKQEFYRRVVVPYEDEKMKQNGDVF